MDFSRVTMDFDDFDNDRVTLDFDDDSAGDERVTLDFDDNDEMESENNFSIPIYHSHLNRLPDLDDFDGDDCDSEAEYSYGDDSLSLNDSDDDHSMQAGPSIFERGLKALEQIYDDLNA